MRIELLRTHNLNLGCPCRNNVSGLRTLFYLFSCAD